MAFPPSPAQRYHRPLNICQRLENKPTYNIRPLTVSRLERQWCRCILTFKIHVCSGLSTILKYGNFYAFGGWKITVAGTVGSKRCW